MAPQPWTSRTMSQSKPLIKLHTLRYFATIQNRHKDQHAYTRDRIVLIFLKKSVKKGKTIGSNFYRYKKIFDKIQTHSQ